MSALELSMGASVGQPCLQEFEKAHKETAVKIARKREAEREVPYD
jgi:hypothetical protein